MPRKARKTSNTKVYHIILRGNDKQDIFFDEQDYRKFIKEITRTKEKYEYQLLAYCLMTNHVHMIIFDKNNQLSKSIQSLAVSYSGYFNKKYEKVGHLFQNRFLSKSVEDKEYLIQLCRYIHQNPIKAKIAEIDKYKWSSYCEYLNENKIIDPKIMLSVFGKEKQEAMKNFIAFHEQEKEDATENDYVEFEIIEKLTDEEVKRRIEAILKIRDALEIKRYNPEIRNEKLQQLKEMKGTTKAQIARVTGINRKILERTMK